MVDVHLAPQIQPWMLEKTYHRPQHSESTASTPDLEDSDGIRLAPSSTEALPDLDSSDALLQDRYLSSEEDLSPTDPESGENFDMEDEEEPVVMEASAVPATPTATSATAKPCNVATAVSYVSAGRAKVVDMSEVTTVRERTYSVTAVANAVPILKSPVPRMSRMSFSSYKQPVSADRPSFARPLDSPKLTTIENRRKSSMPTSLRPTSLRAPYSYDAASAPPVPSLRTNTKISRHYSMAVTPSHLLENERPKLQRSTTDFRSQLTPTPESFVSRSPSPATTDSEIDVLVAPAPITEPRRPSSARSSYSQSPHSKRISTVHVRQRSGSIQLPASGLAATPLTPALPEAPDFLNSDPFAKKEEPKAPEADTNKPAHKRLRSISRTLSLAKIAVLPQGKRGQAWGKGKKEEKKNGDLLSPISPMTNTGISSPMTPGAPSPMLPPTPLTPATPATPGSAFFGPRTSSRMSDYARNDSVAGPVPRPSTSNRPKMEARGANERAPPLELPPFPDDDEPYPPRRRLTKRRSMLGMA